MSASITNSTTDDQGFDINDPARSRAVPMADPDERYAGVPGDEETGPENPLDSAQVDQLFQRLMAFYQDESTRQSRNRYEMATDEDFYDGIQWTEDDRQALLDRGQNPLVLNVIAQTMNWITGTERRGRSDFDVLPRRKDGEAAAEKKTQLLKYLSDVNHTGFKRSRAFKDAAVVGVGWLEDCLSDPSGGEVITTRYENWRNMLWDSASDEYDLSDARYVFRMKWVDLDMAQSVFRDRAALLVSAAGDAGRGGTYYAYGDEVADQREVERELNTGGGLYGGDGRRRVRIIEAWFVVPEEIERIQGSQFHGELYDMFDPTHQALIESGQATTVKGPGMRMYCGIFCTAGMLWLGPSPYRHNKYPFTPIWGYRYGRDQLPYGTVRQLRGVQEDINKRFSKALFILSSNKVVVEEGAVENLKEFMGEVARPDGVLQVKQGRMGSIKIDVDRDLAPAHLELMQHSIAMVQQVGGVTDEMMGRTTNAKSGVAIQARQAQGQMSTSEIFDNLRYAFVQQGEKQLSMVEQFFSQEKQFRITNARGTPQYVTINDSLPENDITRTKADFVIGEEDWRTSMRQAQTDQLFDLISKMPPQIALVLLDLAVEHMDLPNADAIVQRIRQITGQRDPDQTDPTPEDIQRAQAMQAQQQLQQAQIQLQMEEVQSKSLKNRADAERLGALAQQLQANAKLLEAQAIKLGADTFVSAISAAEGAILPGVAGVADAVLGEVGFVPAQVKAAQQAQLLEAAQQEQAAAAAQQKAAQGQAAGAMLLGKTPSGTQLPSNVPPAQQGHGGSPAPAGAQPAGLPAPQQGA